MKINVTFKKETLNMVKNANFPKINLYFNGMKIIIQAGWFLPEVPINQPRLKNRQPYCGKGTRDTHHQTDTSTYLTLEWRNLCKEQNRARETLPPTNVGAQWRADLMLKDRAKKGVPSVKDAGQLTAHTMCKNAFKTKMGKSSTTQF